MNFLILLIASANSYIISPYKKIDQDISYYNNYYMEYNIWTANETGPIYQLADGYGYLMVSSDLGIEKEVTWMRGECGNMLEFASILNHNNGKYQAYKENIDSCNIISLDRDMSKDQFFQQYIDNMEFIQEGLAWFNSNYYFIYELRVLYYGVNMVQQYYYQKESGDLNWIEMRDNQDKLILLEVLVYEYQNYKQEDFILEECIQMDIAKKENYSIYLALIAVLNLIQLM